MSYTVLKCVIVEPSIMLLFEVADCYLVCE